MNNEKIFLRTLAVSIACVCLDLLSVVTIVYREQIPEFLLAVVCKTYLVSLVAVGYSCLTYTRVNQQWMRGKKMRAGVLLGLGLLAIVSIYLLPIAYYHEERVVYTYGPSVIVTYLYAVSCIMFTLYRLVRYRKNMNQKRFRAVCLWLVVWIAASVIQAMNNALLLVGFATAIGMLILFFELENPEANMDRETGLFNSHALMEYMKQKHKDLESFSVLSICMEDSEQTEQVMGDIVSYLGMVPRAKVFKRVDRDLVLLFEHREDLEMALPKIRERFHYEWGKDHDSLSIVIRPSYLVLWDSNLTRSADEILRIIDVCKHENENNENHTVVYIDEEMVGRKRERDEIAKTIQRAMDEDRVEVFYQPIYSVSEQQFVAAEALVRIRSTDGTILPPGVFIPVAEANGSIRMLGEIVFEKTCQFIKNCKLEQYGMHYIEVNLSVEQCESRDLAERYIEIMDRYELNPSWINLEITETGSIKTRKNMLKNMEQLIDYGVCFSLDDFGSGESNLNYIVDMPVEIIKFDRDMTQSFFENEKAQFIMRAARNMIHEMGLKIVAEGVETAEQCSLIEQFGADYIQGYYFSRPLPKDEFVQFLREQGAKQH